MSSLPGGPLRCVVPVDPSGRAVPLFLVHGADGGVDYARALAGYLPAHFPVWGVQMEGYEGAPPPPRTIAELAARYVAEATSVHPDGPYVVVGYSIGGALAFEMVRQLEQQGRRVALSVIIDSRFPPREGEVGSTPAVAALPRPPRPPLQRLWRRFVSSPVKRSITRSCVRFGRPLPALWGIRTRYFWRMLASSRDAWRPGPVDAPVLVVGAEGTASAHRTTWAPLSRSRSRVVEMPVGHLEMIREPFVQELAHHLEASLVQADREARRTS